jgi:outer membrane protein assembly factor BamD
MIKQPFLCIFCIAVLVLSFSAEAKKKNRSYDCNEKVAQAVTNYNLKKYSNVKSVLEDVKIQCNGNPNMDSVYYFLGMSYLKTKMYIEARSELERVVSDFPDSPLFYEAKFRAAMTVYLLAHPVNRDQKETAEAIALFKDILENYPTCPVADSVTHYLNLATDKLAEKEINSARYYVKMSEFESAVVYFQSFITQYPFSKFVDEAKMTTAELLVKLDRTGEAKDALTDLIETGKDVNIVGKAKDLQKKIQ